MPSPLVSRRPEPENHHENWLKQPQPDTEQQPFAKALCQIEAIHKSDHHGHDTADTAQHCHNAESVSAH